MILALTLSAKTCNTLSADYSARLDALSLSLTRTSARACGTLTGDAAAFPKLINTLNRDINGAICRRAVRIAERLTLAADEIGQGLPLDDEPTPSVCEVVAEAPAEVIEAPAEVIEAPAAEALARAERVRASLNVAAAADALAQLSPVEARALFAAPFGVNLYSVPSAALDLTSRPLPNAAVLAVELSAEVVIRVSAPTGAGAELSAPLTLELFERLADGACVRLIRDLERVEGAERLAPVWSLPIAPRTFARLDLGRYALSYAGGVALFQVERGLMVEVLEALGAKGLAAKALRAPAAELPAPVVEAPAPVSAEVVEAPRVTLRPRALTLRALRLAVAAKRGEGARVEPRPALRYAARAPFRALAYLAARHSAIYALLTSTASEARMSWRSCPRAAAEALRWEALAQSDARGCSYCPAGYTWRGVARAVARAEAAAAKAPRRRRAR